MYEAFFGLRRRPFAFAPTADAYFPTEATELIRSQLVRCLLRAEGVGVVIGGAGLGKSMLVRKLASELHGQFRVAILNSGRLATRRSLFQNVLFELKLPYRGLDESELRLSLIDHLEASAVRLHGLALFVDEAHALPIRLIEELRLITNVSRDGEPLVRIVLSGTSRLEETLASPTLESFGQRIAVRGYLRSWTQSETSLFVESELKRVGAVPTGVFEETAAKAIFRATDGIPRLVNQVCDHALVLAHAAHQRHVSARTIEEAWADLQQLPAPWNEKKEAITANVVEFGALQSEPDWEIEESEPFAQTETKNAAQSSLEELHELDCDELALENDPDLMNDQIVALDPTRRDGAWASKKDVNEVELVLDGTSRLFGGEYHDEERVVDRFGSSANAQMHSHLADVRKSVELMARKLATTTERLVDSSDDTRPVASEAMPEAEDDSGIDPDVDLGIRGILDALMEEPQSESSDDAMTGWTGDEPNMPSQWIVAGTVDPDFDPVFPEEDSLEDRESGRSTPDFANPARQERLRDLLSALRQA